MVRFRSIVQLAFVLMLVPAGRSELLCQELFEQTNGPYGGRLFSGIVANDGTVYVATFNFEVYRSSNRGQTWERAAAISQQMLQSIEKVAADSSGRVYAGSDLGVWSSLTQGRSWTKNGPGLPARTPSYQSQIRALQVSEAGTVVMIVHDPRYQERDSLVRSTDFGENWIATPALAVYGGTIHGLSAASGMIYAGMNSTVIRSSDEGASWTATTLSLGTPDRVAEIISNARGEVWVTTEIERALYYSSDRGDHWERKAATGLPPNSEIRTLVSHRDQLLIAQIDDVVYRSTDRGETWTQSINEVFRRAKITSILSASEGTLYAIGNDALVSNDNAITWSESVTGLIASSVLSLAETRTGAVLAGLDGSITRSTDGGENWNPSGSGLPEEIVLDISAFENGVLLAGIRGNGIWKSVDEGHSWSAANIGLSASLVDHIEITGPSEALAATNAGIFRTTNAGESWSASGPGIATSNVTSIVRSGNILLAGTAGLPPQRGSGIYCSTDNGGSWFPVNQGIEDTEIWSLLALEDGTLFAGGDDYIYRSTNRGDTWTRLIHNTFIGRVPVLATNSAGTIYAGIFNDALRSTDNGNTWSGRISMPGANYHLVNDILPVRDGSMYATTRGAGVFRLHVDNGEFWRKVRNEFPSADILSMTGRTTRTKYVATTEGIYRLVDSVGATWYRSDAGPVLDVRAMTDYNEGSVVLAGTTEGLHRYSTSTRQWAPIGTGLPEGGIRSFAVNEPAGVIFAGTMQGIYRSDTNLLQWTEASSGLHGEVNAMTITGSSTVLAAVRGQGLLRSTDMGTTWSAVTGGLPNREILSFAVFGPRTVVAGTDGAGLHISTDDGVTWIARPGSLATARVEDIAFNSLGRILVATDQGLFRESSGTNWIQLNIEPAGPPTRMIITGSGDYLAAYGDGTLWQSTTGGRSSVPGEPAGSGYSRLALQPNPATTLALVGFELDAACRPQLLLSSVSGDLVVRLDAGLRAAGTHTLPIDISGLPAGTWFVRLDGCGRAGSSSLTIVR